MYWHPPPRSPLSLYNNEEIDAERRELKCSREYLLEIRNELAKITHRIDDEKSLEALEKIIESIPI